MGSKAPTTTSTSTVPPAVLAQYQSVLNRANPIAATPYQPYAGQLTAPLNDLQNQAYWGLGTTQHISEPYAATGLKQATTGFNAASGALPYFAQGSAGLGAATPYFAQGAHTIGSAQPYYGEAANLAEDSAGPLNLSQYLNPYTQSVIDSTMANARRNDAIQQQGIISNAIGSGNAFGGDRMGVAQAELARNQDLANNQTIAGLENQNYSQALTAAQADQQRTAQAAQLLGGLGNSQVTAGLGLGQLGSGLTSNSLGYGTLGGGLGNLGGTLTSQGVATAGLGTNAQNNAINAYNAQMAAGTQAQQTAQNDLNAQYQQWANSIAFPYQQLSWLSNISTGIGSGSGGTTTSVGSAPSPVSQILGGATALGALFSLKRGGVVPYRAQGGAVGVQSMFPPAGHAIDFSGIPGGSAGGLIPTIQINQARLNAPRPVDPNAGQSNPLKDAQAFAKGLGNFSGLFNPPTSYGASSSMGAPTGLGGLYRKGGVVPRYADGGDVLDFDQRFAPVQQAIDDGTFTQRDDSGADSTPVPLPEARPQGLGVAPDAVPEPQQGLGAARVADAPSIVPPLFNKLDRQAQGGDFGSAVDRTLGFEGGLNSRDTNGTPSNFGINQKANPDVDVAGLTRDQAKQLYKARYWDAIGADNMPPDLARVAFDTAVIAGPAKAKELVAASGGDPSLLLDLRQKFQNSLIAANPEKYGPYEKAWNNRVAQLRDDIGGGVGHALAFAAPSPRGGLSVAQPFTPPAASGLVPQSPASAGSAPASGLLGRMGATEDQRQAMLALGLGLLASRSPNFGTALGEAGLGAVSSLAAVQKAREEQTQKDREYQLQVQRLNQTAQQEAERLKLLQSADQRLRLNQQVIAGPDGQPMVNPQYVAAQKALDDAKSYKPTWGPISEGTDPQSGLSRKVYGWIDPNNKTITDATGKPVDASTSPTPPGPPPPASPDGKPLSGDDFLASLAPPRAASAKLIGDYEESPYDLPTRGGVRARAVADAKKYNPDFNEQNYFASQQAYKNFSAGQEGRTVRSLNVATDHLETLREAADALKNGNFPLANRIVNSYREQTGSPLTTNFDSITQAVSAEIAKVVVGGPTALQDRDEMASRARNSGSPEQLNGIFDQFTKLMGGQMKGLKQQYEASTHRKDFNKWLLPSTQKALAAVSNTKNTYQEGPATSPPAGAISMLKSNPSLRSAFDQKYGAGAAAKVLGQ